MTKNQSPSAKIKKAKHFLREWRKYRRLTQEELAERIDVTAGAISQLENGLINYTQPTLEALADALDCAPGDILSKDPRLPENRQDVAEMTALLADMPDTFRDRLIAMMREAAKVAAPQQAPQSASSVPKPAKAKAH